MSEKQRRGVEKPEPDQTSAAEPAEGSREAEQGHAKPSAGITNRAPEREQEEQEQVPPRGERKDGSHA